jgi:hypothetical protein
MAIKTSDGQHPIEMSPELARRMAMRIVNVPVDRQEAAFAVVQILWGERRGDCIHRR